MKYIRCKHYRRKILDGNWEIARMQLKLGICDWDRGEGQEILKFGMIFECGRSCMHL